MKVKYIGHGPKISVILPFGVKGPKNQSTTVHFTPGIVNDLPEEDAKKLVESNPRFFTFDEVVEKVVEEPKEEVKEEVKPKKKAGRPKKKAK